MSIKRKLAMAAAAITVAVVAAGCATQGTTSAPAAQPAATAQSCKGMSSCKGKAKCKAKAAAKAEGGSCN